MKTRGSLLISALTISGLIMLGVGAKMILAHAILVSADPEPNGVVNNAPEELWILFSEPIEPAFSQISVFSQSGQQVDTPPPPPPPR